MDNNSQSQSVVAPAPTAVAATTVKTHTSLGVTIALILVSLLAATFIGLFVWMYIQWDNVSTDVNGQIDEAVAIAVNENTTKLQEEFEEKEKYPYNTFSGPEDYGELTFEYPRTWSLYVEKDASTGGNYQAYLNPGGVQPVSSTTVNALRVSIAAQSFDNYVSSYQSYLTAGRLTMSVIQVNGENANLYRGTLPNNLVGAIALIKIRDKTVVLQTDSELFLEDFMKVLASVKYNS